MKSVHYLTNSSSTFAKSVHQIMENFASLGFLNLSPCNDEGVKKETHIYYDHINHSTFSRSLYCFGGFLRQAISIDTEDIFVDYKSTASSKTKRYKVDRVASISEISNAVSFRGKLVKVLETDCETFSYLIQNNNKVCLEISLQTVKLANGNILYFISLRDKTRRLYGKVTEEKCENEIRNIFKDFKTWTDEFSLTQVYNKYCTLLEIHNEKLANRAPF